MHTEPIDYSAEGHALRGMLAVDAGIDTPRPGVVIAHAWKGQGDFERSKARSLAGMGYVSLAADVYGPDVSAHTNEEAADLMTPLVENRATLRSRIAAAVQALRDRPEVDADRIAAIGYCFGGLTVLELARSGCDVAAVVSFHGIYKKGDQPTAERVTTRVLVLHGYEDPFAPPEDVETLAKELTTAGADWQIHMYGHALHAFTNPAANDAELGAIYHPDADRRSWQAMSNFLEECLS